MLPSAACDNNLGSALHGRMSDVCFDFHSATRMIEMLIQKLKLMDSQGFEATQASEHSPLDSL